MTKKSEDTILLSENQAPELDKYRISRIRAQTASMKPGLVDNKMITPNCLEGHPVGGVLGFPDKPRHEIRAIIQIMSLCPLLVNRVIDHS